MKKHFQIKAKTRLFGLMVLMLFTTLAALAQSANVSGTVKDETGESVPRATVVVKGTQTGTEPILMVIFRFKLRPEIFW